jgi:hypothetical protein
MERIRMKQLYPIFEVCPITCLEELRNTMNLHNRWCVDWDSNRAPSEYKLEALILQLTCSFPLSTYHGYKNIALWNTKYILWTPVWPVILISFNTIGCLSHIQHIFIHQSDMVIYQNQIALSDLVLLQCSNNSPLALDAMQECEVTLTSGCQHPEYYL